MFLRGFSKKKASLAFSPPKTPYHHRRLNSCAPRSIWTEAPPPRYIAPRRRFSAAPQCTAASLRPVGRRSVGRWSGREWSEWSREILSSKVPRFHSGCRQYSPPGKSLQARWLDIYPRFPSSQWGVIFWTQKKMGKFVGVISPGSHKGKGNGI